MALIPNLITAAPARMSHSDAAQMKSKHARKVPICIFVKKAARKGKSGAKFREVVYYHVLSGKFKGQLRPKVVAVGEKPRNGVRKMGKFRVTVTDQAAKVYALLDRFHTEAISEEHDHDIDVRSHNRIRAEIMANDPNSSKRGHYDDAVDAVYQKPGLFDEHHKHVKERNEREEARKQKSWDKAGVDPVENPFDRRTRPAKPSPTPGVKLPSKKQMDDQHFVRERKATKSRINQLEQIVSDESHDPDDLAEAQAELKRLKSGGKVTLPKGPSKADLEWAKSQQAKSDANKTSRQIADLEHALESGGLDPDDAREMRKALKALKRGRG